MSDRKLAHIERVVKVEPIPGADKIEKATVLGWEVVVRKGEVKEGDLVCYIEIDSQVPAIPYFDFMADRKYRVKTIKLRGQVSQGLIVPCKQYQDGCLLPLNITMSAKIFREGEDVTDLLGITKYESPSDKESNFVPTPKRVYPWYIKWLTRYQWFRKLTGMRSKSFPQWISKTDEPRIQNMPWVLSAEHEGRQFYVTEKLDGQSATYWYKKQGLFGLFPEFGICSRAVRKSEIDGSNWSKVAKQLDIKNKLKTFGAEIAIQGEIIGPSVQGNKYKLKDFDFYVFNVFDIKNKKYFRLGEAQIVCDCLKLKFVPMIYTSIALFPTVPEMVELSKGKSVLNDKQDREGIVVRSCDQSVSFKVINPDFLLNEKE